MVCILKKGDDLFGKLRDFLRRNRVNSGFFNGLGGFQKAELAFYDLRTKKYNKKKFIGPFETLSITGNVAQGADDIVIHAHVVLGDKNFKTFGGHLINATVGGTLELNIVEAGMLERKFDDETGLELLR
ncbi:MAG: DUF296 domain-containing protein [bacterium]|nr:DUF296 domain-containing protein [bacterium]